MCSTVPYNPGEFLAFLRFCIHNYHEVPPIPYSIIYQHHQSSNNSSSTNTSTFEQHSFLSTIMVWGSGITYPGCLRRRDERWESRIRSEARGRELWKEARERETAERKVADRQSHTTNLFRGHNAFLRIRDAMSRAGTPLTRAEYYEVKSFCLDFPEAGEQCANAQEATCPRRW
jgi:predicted Fe-S protein YdhL (DUF1289 family)